MVNPSSLPVSRLIVVILIMGPLRKPHYSPLMRRRLLYILSIQAERSRESAHQNRRCTGSSGWVLPVPRMKAVRPRHLFCRHSQPNTELESFFISGQNGIACWHASEYTQVVEHSIFSTCQRSQIGLIRSHRAQIFRTSAWLRLQLKVSSLKLH